MICPLCSRDIDLKTIGTNGNECGLRRGEVDGVHFCPFQHVDLQNKMEFIIQQWQVNEAKMQAEQSRHNYFPTDNHVEILDNETLIIRTMEEDKEFDRAVATKLAHWILENVHG